MFGALNNSVRAATVSPELFSNSCLAPANFLSWSKVKVSVKDWADALKLIAVYYSDESNSLSKSKAKSSTMVIAPYKPTYRYKSLVS